MFFRKSWVRGVVLVGCCGLVCGGCADYAQELQDQDTLWSLRKLMSDLWNEHIAGPTSGTKDITVTQPGEGLLRITGSTTGGLNAHNLKYTFTRFSAAVDSGVSLVFDEMTGTIDEAGSWNEVLTLQSDDLSASGSLTRDGYDPVQLEGPLFFQGSFEARSGSGSVNGRPPVHWDLGGGGGGGGDCALYTIACGKIEDGVKVVGGIVPQRCDCPPDTDFLGVDIVTPGGPYNMCGCKCCQ